MTLERRHKLIDALIEEGPRLRGAISNQSAMMMEGNWSLVAFSYQQAFDVLWDHTAAQQVKVSLFVGPLMMLWRQSVELTIKAAIKETAPDATVEGHQLTRLFDDLLKARAAINGLEDDGTAYTKRVRATVVEFQKFDEKADRYRYPTDKDGKSYVGFAVDLDRIYQAHWLITNWCEAAIAEAEQHRAIVREGADVVRLTADGLRLRVR